MFFLYLFKYQKFFDSMIYNDTVYNSKRLYIIVKGVLFKFEHF